MTVKELIKILEGIPDVDISVSTPNRAEHIDHAIFFVVVKQTPLYEYYNSMKKKESKGDK